MNDDSIYRKYPNYQFINKKLSEQVILKASHSNIVNSRPIQVQQVIGESKCSPVIEFSLPFPEKYPAFELVESITNVEGLTAYILKDIVVIDGNIHKKISYIAFEDQYNYSYTNQSLNGSIGNLKILSTDIPFSCSMKIPGILKSDTVHFEYAGTDSSYIVDFLEGPLKTQKENVTLHSLFKEKLIINIHIKVLRKVQTNLPGAY